MKYGDRIEKSLGAERTYDYEIITLDKLSENVLGIIEILTKRIEKFGEAGKSLTLKIKYADFQQITRSKTLPENFTNPQIKNIALELLNDIPNIEKGIRLIGLQTSNFETENNDVFMGQLAFDF